ncbi:replication-associated protein [Dragonfly cyclicusvirus]|uniref:ATP-dependent helicase Rep n=1 Tax=Dragonfly cyclicusvirus TaxID=1234878 RepID=K0A2I6_9VIRU|nr:replication-associated protein [Dragonfly cyclicusvirus]AFS65303.1 replication-associated protein [Dragonfly cyclicusvirus]
MGSPAIGWCFTLNNYTEIDEQVLQALDVKYLVYGHEVGEGGTPHLQGYLELHKKKRFKQVKEMLGERYHIEMRRGTAAEVDAYCRKQDENNVFTKGTMGGQGLRSDLDRVRLLAAESGMRAVAATANYQQIKTAEIYLTYNEEPRSWKPTVYWIYGASGTGKTRKAYEICGTEDTYVKVGTHKWWDGYDGHENVIIDDFRPMGIPFVDLLGILDRYEFRVEVKGKMRQMLAKTIVITTIYPPEVLYVNLKDEPLQQLLRRIDHFINFNLNSILDNIEHEFEDAEEDINS